VSDIKYMYMAMDGRAKYDIGRASVMSCIGEVSEKKARKEFKDDWSGYDACLVRYEITGNEIRNPVVIGDNP